PGRVPELVTHVARERAAHVLAPLRGAEFFPSLPGVSASPQPPANVWQPSRLPAPTLVGDPCFLANLLRLTEPRLATSATHSLTIPKPKFIFLYLPGR